MSHCQCAAGGGGGQTEGGGGAAEVRLIRPSG